MAATIKYDSITSRQLAVNTTPDILMNEGRNISRMSTASGTIAFDTSYPTGGYAASPAKFGLSSINGVFFSHPGGYVVVYNASTDKVQVYESAGAAGALAEVANATDLHTLPAVYFEAKGLS